jgi:16S rRNA (guanine527-N7)-methyltransferase
LTDVDPALAKLIKGAKALDVSLTDEQGLKLLAYLDAMLDENTRVNLTAIRDRDEGIVRHLLDSLSLVEVWRDVSGDRPPRRVLDLGTGGGFPGLPLAVVWPRTEVFLVDSTGKKIRAIERALEAIGGVPNARPLQARGNQLRSVEPRLKYGVDLAVARAVGRTEKVLPEFRGLISKGGWIFSMKGPEPPHDEVKAAQRVAAGLRFEVPRPRETSVPELLARTVLVYRRK